MASPFAQTAPLLIARGYSPLPITPGGKSPGDFSGSNGWHHMKGWNRYCGYQPFPNVIAAWAKWPDAGVGVACGMGLICIDIDQEDIVPALLEILPPSNVQKKGRKGISLFYRGNTDKIRSKNYRTPERVGLVDLLAEGKQTVLPPSIHPDTGEPYYWWTDDTLPDTPLHRLAELPDDIADKIGEVLKAFGYDPDHERHDAGAPVACPVSAAQRSDATNLFREVNDLALANLHAWVPALGMRRCYRVGGGFKAVAEWRSSGTGRSFERRAPNLSFTARGIRDFGDGLGYSPIDVVMAVHRISASDALEWLGERVSPRWRDEPLILLTTTRWKP